MWFFIWLKFLSIAMTMFAALLAIVIGLFCLGQWLDRRFAIRVPGLLISLWLLAGRQQEIHAERDRKLEAARKERRIRHRQAA